MSQDEILPTSELKITELHSQLAKAYKDWSLTLLILGALNLVLSFVGLTSAQGALFFFVTAAAVYFFRVTAMFLIVGFMMLWTALGNLLAVAFNDQSFFAFDILIFVIFAFRAFYHYRKFRPYEADPGALPIDERDPRFRLSLAQRTFPFGGCAISALALGVFAIVWIATAVLVSLDPGLSTLDLETAIYSFTMELAILAFSVSLAALISGYSRKPLAVAGLISSLMAFLCQLVFFPIV
jgi:hypothetical protein